MKHGIGMMVLVAATLAFVACPKVEETTCSYNGKSYLAGASFSDSDGCNTCTCSEDGSVACTAMACPDGCNYNSTFYEVGETFDAEDGCNTCECTDDDTVACTEMACNPEPGECSDDQGYFEPGCGGENGIVEIEAGCYQQCGSSTDTPCQTGICQRTDINPCVCQEGMDCCDACGQEIWLCLPEPETCISTATDPIITQARRSFGECMGDCTFELVIAQASEDDASGCNAVTLTVSDTAGPPRRTNLGTLTPAGHARARALAAALVGKSLEETYGCPDCADGGASGFSLRRESVETHHKYEFSKPPDDLAAVDAFTQGLITALNACTANDNVDLSDDCAASSL